MKTKIGFLPQEAKENLATVLQRMNAGRKLTYNNNGILDSRIVRCELPEIKTQLITNVFIPTGTTTILTKNREYEVDNETGDVSVEINPLKYLFISNSKMLKKISSIIGTVKNHFDNSEIVQQVRFTMYCFHPKIIKELQEKFAAIRKHKTN